MFYYVLRNTPRHSLDSATRQAGIGFDSAQWLTRLVSMSFFCYGTHICDTKLVLLV